VTRLAIARKLRSLSGQKRSKTQAIVQLALHEELQMRTLHTLDYSDAKRIIDLVVESAVKMQKAAVIAVADSHGELIAFARMDGVSP
jgi:glucokinase